MIPTLASAYLPVLASVFVLLWPTMAERHLVAGQVEQETCATLTHRNCWNPRAELKTSREYGFGLGQLTVTPRFNNFAESHTWDKSLSKWDWEQRYDPQMQLRALVAYDRNLHSQISFAATDEDRFALMFAAYNGGLAGVLKDRRLCGFTKGCDPSRWFGHIELNSFKAKTAVSGYGKSFFEVNREYVRNIMRVRSAKYRGLV